MISGNTCKYDLDFVAWYYFIPLSLSHLGGFISLTSSFWIIFFEFQMDFSLELLYLTCYLVDTYVHALVNSVCGLTVNFPEFLYNHDIHHLYHRKYYHSRQSRLRNVVKQWSQGVQGQHNQHTCNDKGNCLQHMQW